MNRLFLLFHGRFPSEKAASLFAAKEAEAFGRSGMKVTVVSPRRRFVADKDPFVFYDIERNFEVKYLPTVDLFGFIPNKLAFLVSFLSFSISSFFFIKKNSVNADIIYSNETLPLLLISFIRKNCFFEMHDFPESKLRLFGKFLDRMRWILIHNRWKLAQTERVFPELSRKKLLYEQNAVDTEAFDISLTSREARDKLNLPRDRILVVYTGHLYDWKGVYTMAESANFLTDHYLLVFVGGTESDVEKFREKYGRNRKMMIVGHRPHKEIPFWQKAADILVLPNTGRVMISTHYTSPMKLYEYMASRRPIVASFIPSILEIVDRDSAILVEPDNPKALSEAIDALARNRELGEKLSAIAYDDVLNHTWQARAERILDFIKRGRP